MIKGRAESNEAFGSAFLFLSYQNKAANRAVMVKQGP